MPRAVELGAEGRMGKHADIIIVGAGHNGLVSAVLLARAGLDVLVLEEKASIGGAVKTEYPFRRAPELGISSGAYLLGLMPPEILAELGLELPLVRRDPHYFLPTTGDRYLLLGSDREAMREQFLRFFTEDDWDANAALNDELGRLRDDLAPSWLMEPFSVEETADRFIRPELRADFVRLCRGSARAYLERFGFRSDLLKAMYAVTDAFSGCNGGGVPPREGVEPMGRHKLPGPRRRGARGWGGRGMGVTTPRAGGIA